MVQLTSVVLVALLVLASAGGAAGAGATVRLLYQGSRGAPVVALTFDDGWSASRCAKILDILERRHVAATFFPYARAVAAAPAFWRRVAADGYPIANHTTTHPDMSGLSLAEATWEIARARAIIEGITGHEMIRVFRPPYGAWNGTVLAAARAAGFPTVLLWDTSAADTSHRATSGAMIRAAFKGHNGSVVLMHCGPAVTPTILEEVIDGYMARGFGFVTVPQLLSGKVPTSAFATTPSEPPTVGPLARMASRRVLEPMSLYGPVPI